MELAILKYWDSVWQHYENKADTLYALQGIYFLLSNPDLKHIELDELSDPLSLREVIKLALKKVKGKVENLAEIKTIIKGVIDEAAKSDQDSTTFDVEIVDSGFRQIGFKRKNVSILRSKAQQKTARGAVVAWTNKDLFDRKVNVYQSIKAAITDGSFVRDPLHISIDDRHLRYPVYQSKQSLNTMLVLDISNSIKWILKFIEKVISALTIQARASKDKLGLIVFNNDRAQIMHYPTINIKHVIGTINTLQPKGKSPLAEGVKIALQALEHSRFQVVGMTNAIVLLSDCFPEPLSGEYADQMDEPVCQELLHVCDKIAETGIKFLVLNPCIGKSKNYDKLLGYRLGTLAAERANGKHLNLEANMYTMPFAQHNDYEITSHGMQNLIKEMSSIRFGD